MAVYTLVPTAFKTQSDSTGGRWTPAATATRQAYLADSSDTTYVRRIYNKNAWMTFALTTPTIGAGEVIVSVQVVARVKASTTAAVTKGQSQYYLAVGSNESSVGKVPGAPKTATSYPLTVMTESPKSKPWTTTDIGALRLKVFEAGVKDSANNATDFLRVEVKVTTIARPTVTGVSPSGTIVDTTKPTISWTFDADGDIQDAADIVVYKRPGASWPAGFTPYDPAYDTYKVESASVRGDIDLWTMTKSLTPGGVYRFYVRGTNTVGTLNVVSDWAYSTATCSPASPTKPTISGLVWNAGTQSASMTLTGAAVPAGYDAASQTFGLERSTDAGVSWSSVRGATELVPNGSFVVTVTDHEAPRSGALRYRAFASARTSSDGLIVQTAPSTHATVTATSDGTWWLKACGTPSLNWGGARVVGEPSGQVVETVGVFTPHGSGAHVVVSGGFYGYAGSYQLFTSTAADWTKLSALLEFEGMLLVQDPFGGHKYVRLTSRSVDLSGTPSAPQRTVTVDWVQVGDGLDVDLVPE